MLAGEESLPEPVRRRLRTIRASHTAAGLASSLRGAGQGAMEPLHQRLAGVRAPTLVIIGADDPARRRAEAVAQGIPGARLAVVPGAGHAPHLAAPGAFHDLVRHFLEEELPR